MNAICKIQYYECPLKRKKECPSIKQVFNCGTQSIINDAI